MLSYRHSFHAGNHADVLKHLALIAILEAQLKKPTPICYVDSHAGAGRYALDSAEARKTGESADGVGRLLNHPAQAPLLRRYLELIQAADAAPQHYPGAPCLAQTLLRAQDRLVLCELHPAEIEHLRHNCRGDARVAIHQRDGFEALRALLPPAQARCLVLIDPAYELKSDYAACAEAVSWLRRHVRSAVIALWFPCLPGKPADDMRARILAQPGTEVLELGLSVREPLGDFGMYGSGMLICQPPWQIDEQIRAALAELAPRLAAHARFTVKVHPAHP